MVHVRRSCTYLRYIDTKIQSFSKPIINWFSCPQEVVKQAELVKEVMLSRKLSFSQKVRSEILRMKFVI